MSGAFSQTKLDDFIVTNENDTIHGVINKTRMTSRLILNSKSGIKYKIKKKLIKSFCKDNTLYYRYKIPGIGSPGKITENLKLIHKGKASLYTYEFSFASLTNFNNHKKRTTYYYIEKDNKIKYIRPDRFSKIMIVLFADDNEFVERIKSKEFSFGNILSLVQEYNKSN